MNWLSGRSHNHPIATPINIPTIAQFLASPLDCGVNELDG